MITINTNPMQSNIIRPDANLAPAKLITIKPTINGTQMTAKVFLPTFKLNVQTPEPTFFNLKYASLDSHLFELGIIPSILIECGLYITNYCKDLYNDQSLRANIKTFNSLNLTKGNPRDKLNALKAVFKSIHKNSNATEAIKQNIHCIYVNYGLLLELKLIIDGSESSIQFDNYDTPENPCLLDPAYTYNLCIAYICTRDSTNAYKFLSQLKQMPEFENQSYQPMLNEIDELFKFTFPHHTPQPNTSAFRQMDQASRSWCNIS